jgi:hypothetical protein
MTFSSLAAVAALISVLIGSFGVTSSVSTQSPAGAPASGANAQAAARVADAADIAVLNAKVVTLDAKSRVAEAVAIRGGRSWWWDRTPR